MMNQRLQSGLVRRLGLAMALTLVGSSAALAFGFNPGSWKVTDSSKTVRKRLSGMQYAIIQNKGADSIAVSSKGSFETVMGVIPAGEKATVVMPLGSKNVKLVDANFGNGMGSKGTLIWSQKLSATGQVIDTKPKL